jgi:hypothetical protein
MAFPCHPVVRHLSHDPGRTRTCNLWFRRPTPYPLGHRAPCSPRGPRTTKFPEVQRLSNFAIFGPLRHARGHWPADRRRRHRGDRGGRMAVLPVVIIENQLRCRKHRWAWSARTHRRRHHHRRRHRHRHRRRRRRRRWHAASRSPRAARTSWPQARPLGSAMPVPSTSSPCSPCSPR